MNINKLMSSLALAMLALAPLGASGANIDANTARINANNFIHQHASASFKAASLSDFQLAHAEASSVTAGTNVYYVFNIKGGGFVIVAGEDRAPQVLGYSDRGRFDANQLPAPLTDLLDGYKHEIEFLQTYTSDDLVPMVKTSTDSRGVEPLIQTTWGQEDPYDWQCPTQNGEYCVVGCVATAMAQVMYYWKYPEGCDAISSYSPWFSSVTYPGLPATTFDYNKMLLSYCHWDWDNSQLIQDTYTDEQAQAVAKLSRYCGQAVEMDYSPEGSGAYTWNQYDAMINTFGYRSTAEDVSKNGGWWLGAYSTAQWEAMMKEELDAGRPILYSASDPSAGGHAFICDGYNNDGYFHFNLGWYGTCDGWYLSTSLRMTHRDGDQLNFSSSHEMLIGIEPPEGWVPPTQFIRGDVNNDGSVTIDDVTALIDYLLSDNATGTNIDAADCNEDSAVTIDDVTALIDYLLTTQW